nr:agmatine deiminase family protein [Flavobacterium sp.]
MKKPLFFAVVFCIASITQAQEKFTIPAEFEPQEYIWLSWVESGFLGGEPFCDTALAAMREITPYSKIRLFYGPTANFNKQQMQSRIWKRLLEEKVDTSRVALFYNPKPYGAIQDPGPIFLRNENEKFAVADFNFNHPDERSKEIDRNVAKYFGLPTIKSDMISEGGAWQTNGKGTLLLVESVEFDRNPKMSRAEIESEYKRVLGVSKIIWLKKGAKEEEWGRLENGLYGIGTGGHIDEFCRFADHNTILLAEVSDAEARENPIAKETQTRMRENYEILEEASDQDGKPFTIIRIPIGPLLSEKVKLKSLSVEEKSWFEGATSDEIEFYLATGYLNFIIANGVVITAKYWKPGADDDLKKRDDNAKKALEKAFPNRKIVQIDCMALHHDGAGLHCHSRNQPVGVMGK